MKYIEFYRLWVTKEENEPFEKMVNGGKMFDDFIENQTAVVIKIQFTFIVLQFKTDT